MSENSKLDYESMPEPKETALSLGLRAGSMLMVVILVLWALTVQSHLMLSSRIKPVTNEEFAVSVLVYNPAARGEFKSYSIRSFGGFHFVRWDEWRKGEWYLLIPKWAVLMFSFVLALGVMFWLRIGRRRRTVRS